MEEYGPITTIGCGVRRGLTFLALALISLMGGCESGVSEQDIRTMNAIEVRTLKVEHDKNPNRELLALIDARAHRRFEAGHIPGAINAQTPDYPEGMPLDPKLARRQTIVVYGQNPGDLSARVLAKRLLYNGYGGVRLFPGGLEEWSRMGWSVEAPPPPPEPSEPEGEPASDQGAASR